MPIPVAVPGLDLHIREVPDGQILLIEGGLDPSKSHFVQHLARIARKEDRPARLVTSRSRADVAHAYDRTGGRPEGLAVDTALDLAGAGLDEARGDLFIDSFSFLTLGLTDSDLAAALQRLRARVAQDGSIAVLAIERGMLHARSEAIVAHLSDGILQFHHREDNEGVVQYLRIPKWMTGEVFTRNIHYTFDGRRLLIDTRRRVV